MKDILHEVDDRMEAAEGGVHLWANLRHNIFIKGEGNF
jgi:hypothetical protein